MNLIKVPGYQDGLQIDRIDNDGDCTIVHPIYGSNIWIDEYGNQCLGNLRWVTQKFNNMNRSVTITMESLENIPRTKFELKRIFMRHFHLIDYSVKVMKI